MSGWLLGTITSNSSLYEFIRCSIGLSAGLYASIHVWVICTMHLSAGLYACMSDMHYALGAFGAVPQACVCAEILYLFHVSIFIRGIFIIIYIHIKCLPISMWGCGGESRDGIPTRERICRGDMSRGRAERPEKGGGKSNRLTYKDGRTVSGTN